MQGKTVLVTGANSGVGYQTCLGLSKLGARVILACRSQQKGETAIANIKTIVPEAFVELMILDLSDLNSVKNFTQNFMAKYDKLDILINNAAVMSLPKRILSPDGFEMQFATNHLGHFALTGLLLPVILKSSQARVITVSSIAHKNAKIEFDNLQGEKHYDPFKTYAKTKLANLLFAFELDRKLKEKKLSAISLATHPGVAKTNIIVNGVQVDNKMTLLGHFMSFMVNFIAQSDLDGARSSIYACCDQNIQGQDYIGYDGLLEMSGRVKKIKARPKAYDLSAAERLWLISENLTQVKYQL